MRWVLFTTKDCAACERMKRNLFEAEIKYDIIDMDKDEKLYDKMHFSFVRHAPTLVLIDKGKIVDSHGSSLPVHELLRLKAKYKS
jgi:glutaredoxin